MRIPPALLKLVNRRAKALGVSSNRLIVQVLEREVRQQTTWSPGFLDRLRNVDPATSSAVDEMLADVEHARRSKRPPAS